MQRDAALAAIAPAPKSCRPATQTPEPDTSYLVAYGTVVDDKVDGIYLKGVYFGGIAGSHDEAEALARECVNGVKGGIVFPRIVPMNNSCQVLEAMQRATKRFEQMEAQMIQAEEIMARSNTRSKARTKSA